MQDPRLNQAVWVARNFREHPEGDLVLFLGNSVPVFPAGLGTAKCEVGPYSAMFYTPDDKLIAVVPHNNEWLMVSKTYLIQMDLSEFLEFGQSRTYAIENLLHTIREELAKIYPETAKRAQRQREDPTFMLAPIDLGQVEKANQAHPQSDDRTGHYL